MTWVLVLYMTGTAITGFASKDDCMEAAKELRGTGWTCAPVPPKGEVVRR